MTEELLSLMEKGNILPQVYYAAAPTNSETNNTQNCVGKYKNIYILVSSVNKEIIQPLHVALSPWVKTCEYSQPLSMIKSPWQLLANL